MLRTPAPLKGALGVIMSSLGGKRYTCDRAATENAYSRADIGGVESCSCEGCRNFVLVRDEVFPPSFLALLESLGIDPRKDGETYHIARDRPGRHYYGGWFHFVGDLQTPGDSRSVELEENFIVSLCEALAPCLETLKGSA